MISATLLSPVFDRERGPSSKSSEPEQRLVTIPLLSGFNRRVKKKMTFKYFRVSVNYGGTVTSGILATICDFHSIQRDASRSRAGTDSGRSVTAWVRYVFIGSFVSAVETERSSTRSAHHVKL